MFNHDPQAKLRSIGWALHAVGLALVLSSAWLAHAGTIGAVNARIAECRARSAELAQVSIGTKKIRAQHQRLTGTVARLQKQVAGLRERVPDERLEGEFLSQVTRAAGEADFQIRDYTPGSVRAGAGYSKMEIQLAGSGSYRSVCGFLDRLQQLPRLSRITRLELAAAPQSEDYPVKLTLLIFFGLPESSPSAPGVATNG